MHSKPSGRPGQNGSGADNDKMLAEFLNFVKDVLLSRYCQTGINSLGVSAQDDVYLSHYLEDLPCIYLIRGLAFDAGIRLRQKKFCRLRALGQYRLGA